MSSNLFLGTKFIQAKLIVCFIGQKARSVSPIDKFKKVKVIKIIIDMALALKIIIQNLRLKIKFIHLYKILSF